MQLDGVRGLSRRGVIPALLRHDLHRGQREGVPTRADDGHAQLHALGPRLHERPLADLQRLAQRLCQLFGVLDAGNAMGGAAGRGLHTQRKAARKTTFHLGKRRFHAPQLERAARKRQRLRDRCRDQVLREVVVRLERLGERRLVVGEATHRRAAANARQADRGERVLDVAGFAVTAAQAADGRIGLRAQQIVDERAVRLEQLGLVLGLFQRRHHVVRRGKRALGLERAACDHRYLQAHLGPPFPVCCALPAQQLVEKRHGIPHGP